MFTYPSPAPLTDFSKDKLNLKSFADDLTSLVVSQLPHPTNESSKVIALDSGWGTGKTSFINMWTEQLETDKFTYLIYNAWKNDDSPNALIPILCSFQQEFAQKPNVEVRVKKILASVLDRVSVSIPLPLPVGSTLNIAGGTKTQLSDMILDEFSARQDHKKSLEDLINDIRGKDKYLIICIDELDRCRPTFAIETLEVVKHFFDIPQVVFVFSLDMNQLQKSIKTIYGDIDSMGYLQRFFDYIRPLPEPKRESLVKFLRARVGYDLSEQDIKVLVHLSKPFRISLRAFNVICAVYNQFKRYTEYNHNWDLQWTKDPIYYKVYLTLIALKYSNLYEYRSFIQNGTDFEKQNDIISPDVKKLLRDLFCVKRFESCYTKRIANSSLETLLKEDDPLRREIENHFYIGDEGVNDGNGSVFHPIDRSIPLYEYIDRNIEDSWAKAVHQLETAHMVMEGSFQKIKEEPMVYGLDLGERSEDNSISLKITKNISDTKYDVTINMNDDKWCVDTYVNGEYIQYLTYNYIEKIAEKCSNSPNTSVGHYLATDEVIKAVSKKLSDEINGAIRIYQDWVGWKTKAEDFEKNKQIMNKEILFTWLTDIYGGSRGILTSDEIKCLCKLAHRLVIYNVQDLKEICAVYNQFKTNLRKDHNQKFYSVYMTLIAMSQFKYPEDISWVFNENTMDYIIHSKDSSYDGITDDDLQDKLPPKYRSLLSNGADIDNQNDESLKEIYTKVFGYKDKISGLLRSCYTKEVATSNWYDPNTWVSSAPYNVKDQLAREIRQHFIDVEPDCYSADGNYLFSLFSMEIERIICENRESAKKDNYIVKIKPKELKW